MLKWDDSNLDSKFYIVPCQPGHLLSPGCPTPALKSLEMLLCHSFCASSDWSGTPARIHLSHRIPFISWGSGFSLCAVTKLV